MADEPDIALMDEMEFEGHGGNEQGQISGYVQGLAQEVSQQLESWMEDGVLTDSMLEPMIELLKQVFVDFEHYYVRSLQVDELKEERETLHQSFHTMKEKYHSTVERHNAYVDQLEQENREEKHSRHQLREKTADLTSRLMNAKSALEELQEVYEQAKLKQKEETRKLYNAIEFYRSSSERKDHGLSLRRKLQSNVKGSKLDEVAHSLTTTSTGIPLIPDSDRTFSPEPTNEDTLSLTASECSSLTQQQSEGHKERLRKESLKQELESLQNMQGDDASERLLSSPSAEPAALVKTHEEVVSDENEPSEGDQQEVDQLREQMESSENSYSWVEVENAVTAPATAEIVHRATASGRRPPALSLAQEFELLAPEEFAQTEMQQILEQRDEAINEKEKLQSLKQKLLVDLDAFKNQNVELKKIIEECKAREESLSEELSSARRDHEKALQESLPDEDLAFTKKEMFGKIKELLQVKNRCYFLEEDNRKLKGLLNQKKTPKQKSLLSAIFDKVFGRSRSAPHVPKELKAPAKAKVYRRSVTPTMSNIQLLQGVTLDNYTLCDHWLLGCQATGVMSSLPDYIGRIPLKGLEISRVDYCTVARINKSPFTPDSSPTSFQFSSSPVAKSFKSSNFVGANSRGQCLAEIWVGTSHESLSHVEVISVFSPTEKQVQQHFVTKCQHIQCMLAVPGCVPVSEEYRRRSRSGFSPPPAADLSLVDDNKHPLREESPSPDLLEEWSMWIISDTKGLYFHNINKDCHRELNHVDLERDSFCIEHAGDRVFIGQSEGNVMIFNKSKTDNHLWNIQKPFVVGISCEPDKAKTHVNCIKKICGKLWISIGEVIYIMDPLLLGIEVCRDDNRIIINESKENEYGSFINFIEEVNNLAVVSFYRRSVIKVFESVSGSFIKEIDISTVCAIIDKLPTSPQVSTGIARVMTLASNAGVLYVGTRCGKMIVFSAKTLTGDIDDDDSEGEDYPDGRKKRKKLKKLAAAAEREKEEARLEYEKQLVDDLNGCAIAVYTHKFSLRSILCLSLPTLPLQPNLSVVYNSLVVTVGKGFHHIETKSSNPQLQFPSSTDSLSDHAQLLVWGNAKKDNNTTIA